MDRSHAVSATVRLEKVFQMKQVLLGNSVYRGLGLAVVLAVGLASVPASHAQVEGVESPRFGPATPPATPPANPMAAPPAAAPLPGEQLAPVPAPQDPTATEQLQPQAAAQTPVEEQIKLGQELMNQGKIELALQHFEEATKLAEDRSVEKADAYFQLGNAFRSLQRFDEAIDAYSASITNKDDDEEAYLRRGIVWFYKGEYDIAWNDFEDAALIVRESPEPYPELWKGFAKAKQGEWLDAVTAYSKALLQDPRFALAYTNRGLAYLQLNEPEKAVLDFNQAIRNDPHSPVHYYRRGIAFARMGQVPAAIESYNQALRLAPDFADAAKNRSLLQGKAGR